MIRAGSVRLSRGVEIEQYVLSWGTHASVVEPRELRARLGTVGLTLCGGTRTLAWEIRRSKSEIRTPSVMFQ
jgi:hypothetical protein